MSCTSILKPPVVPMPRTGGGATLITNASWIEPNCLLSAAMRACALSPFLARSLKSSSGVNTTAELGAVVKVAPSRPPIGTPGIAHAVHDLGHLARHLVGAGERGAGGKLDDV